MFSLVIKDLGDSIYYYNSDVKHENFAAGML